MSDLVELIWVNLLKKKAATPEKNWSKVKRLVAVSKSDVSQAVEKALKAISPEKGKKS